MYCCLYSEHLATRSFASPKCDNADDSFADDLLEKEFTEAEEILFQKRFEEGYNLTNDDRYNTWLKLQHTVGEL